MKTFVIAFMLLTGICYSHAQSIGTFIAWNSSPGFRHNSHGPAIEKVSERIIALTETPLHGIPGIVNGGTGQSSADLDRHTQSMIRRTYLHGMSTYRDYRPQQNYLQNLTRPTLVEENNRSGKSLMEVNGELLKLKHVYRHEVPLLMNQNSAMYMSLNLHTSEDNLDIHSALHPSFIGNQVGVSFRLRRNK